MVTKRKTQTKKKSKKKITTKTTKKTKPKSIGKFSGIVLPLPSFPRGEEKLKGFCIDIAKQINKELADTEGHIKEKNFDLEYITMHLSNTNMMLDRMLFLIIHLFHLDYHSWESMGEIGKIKRALKEVDINFKKHTPQLEYIDKQVQAHRDSEERAKNVYG